MKNKDLHMKSIIAPVLLALVFGTHTVAFADHEPYWLDQTKNGKRLADAKDCADFWNIFWPAAKAGDLEARAILFYLMIPPPDMSFLYAPGNSGDLISRQRDINVMAVHSIDYSGPFEPHYRELALEQFISAGFDFPPGKSKFLECVKKGGKGCADIAVKARLVPSFEEFARQIDAMTAAGMKSSCR